MVRSGNPVYEGVSGDTAPASHRFSGEVGTTSPTGRGFPFGEEVQMTNTKARAESGRHESDPRTERTRSAIEQAARDLLHEAGPDAVTHAHVALAANVSRTTVYKHHSTRASLVRAAIEIEDPFPDEFTGDLRTDLMAMLGHLVDDLADDDSVRMFATFIERSSSDPELHEIADGMVCRGREMFTQLLAEGVRSGQLCSGIDPDFAMAGLIGTFLFRCFFSHQPVDRDVAAEVIDHFLVHHAPS